ncbi:MAG: DUF177 domain-containing protein [Clostridiales bacterium]|jgi:uncharacterized protein|nr:DUF177 domain-containing protein [Clostridiales bacterium]
MLLNIRKIIEEPGEIPFSFEIDMSDVHFDSVHAFLSPLTVKGSVVNSAGVLTMDADLEIESVFICDRCSSHYQTRKRLHAHAVLAQELQDEDNPDIYLLEGDNVNLTEIIYTIFILNMETKSLCKEDCRGICASCGKNLNEGACGCKPEPDPRLAVLKQLLNE